MPVCLCVVAHVALVTHLRLYLVSFPRRDITFNSPFVVYRTYFHHRGPPTVHMLSARTTTNNNSGFM